MSAGFSMAMAAVAGGRAGGVGFGRGVIGTTATAGVTLMATAGGVVGGIAAGGLGFVIGTVIVRLVAAGAIGGATILGAKAVGG